MKNSSEWKRNLAILTGLSITTLHFINRFESTTACSFFENKTREDKTYEWRYGKISYKKKGNGTPLLLLHDLTIGSSKAEYKYIYEELSKNNTVYIPDIIGYGDSDKPAMTYTASVIEQLIADFIKTIIGTKTNIVVSGTTAPIVLKLTKEQPKLIGKIIMINPLGLYDQNLIPSNETKLLKILMDIPIIGTFGYNVNSTRNRINQIFKNDYIYDSDNFNQSKLNEIVSNYYRSAHVGGFHAKYSHASYMSQYMTCSILHEMKEIDNSVLLLAGQYEKDIDSNIENYQYYNNAIESEIIPETKHLPHIEKPEAIIESIGVFLS